MPASRIPSSIISLPVLNLSTSRIRLEDHFVRVLAAPQAEASAQVCLKVGLLLNCRNQRLVNRLLVRNALRIDILLLGRCFTLLEERILALALFLLARPVLVLAHAVQDFRIEVRDIDGCAGRNYVAVVDAAKGDTVGLERTGDQENALIELAQEDDALAGKATGEKDEDSAGLKRLAVFGGVCGLAGLLMLACDRHIAASHLRSDLSMRQRCSQKCIHIPSSSAPPPLQGSSARPSVHQQQ